MTAEIAVLNPFGVALAADSAVSIGDKKVYNSANKLFALSKIHPVGIMIYGNAKFMNAPWEVLIKYFRRNVLKERSFKTLEQYRDLFLDFISRTNLIPEENEQEFVSSLTLTAAQELYGAVKGSVEEALKKNGKISKATSLTLTSKAVDGWLAAETASQMENKSHATKAQVLAIRKKYSSNISKAIGSIFGTLGVGVQRQKKIVDAILKRLSCQNYSFLRAGLVVAGYGDDDLYPSTLSCSVSGRVCGFLRVNSMQKSSVSLEHRSWVSPFAQREMVDTFIGGIDPDFQKAINKGLAKALERVTKEILPQVGVPITPNQQAAIVKELELEINKFRDAINHVQQEEFAQPVLSSVAALPIDELAAMAEALVSLTSFKRKVTMVPESVGGPVDVAVISKGDGFIWIKRKHYFKPELNQHYILHSSKH